MEAQDTFVRPMRIFSGIQPTGRQAPRQLHRGDSASTSRRQERGRRRFYLHRRPALDHGRLRPRPTCASARSTLAAILFATGLDPERCTVFAQSHVTEHAEAAWLLSARDELRRAPAHDPVQGEGATSRSSSRRRLFTLPGAAWPATSCSTRPTSVPVGEDQRQHVELTRDVARALQRALRRDLRRCPKA